MHANWGQLHTRDSYGAKVAYASGRASDLKYLRELSSALQGELCKSTSTGLSSTHVLNLTADFNYEYNVHTARMSKYSNCALEYIYSET